jgi:GNAT superfamily N-acetyltransferase
VDAADIELCHTVDAERLPQLMDLYANAWWTSGRTASKVARMLQASDVVVALVHRPSDRLVGFCRVITDDTYVGLLLDVIVAADHRATGLGAMLMNAVVEHPRLAQVESLELTCQPEVMAFYRRWGFTDQVGRSQLMRRAGRTGTSGSTPAG